MPPLGQLGTLFDLWNWAVETQGTTHANAALQALPFYNTMKVWLEDNSVAPEDWIDQIWEYTWNDAISWQENFKQMTELRPKIGTIELNTVSVPDDSMQIDDIELVVNENQLAIAAIKTIVDGLDGGTVAIIGTSGDPVDTQIAALLGTLDHTIMTWAQWVNTLAASYRDELTVQQGDDYNATRDQIVERVNVILARIGTDTETLRENVYEYVAAAQTAILDDSVAHFDTIQADQATALTAIGAVTTDVNAHTDEVRTSLNSDIQVITDAAIDVIAGRTYDQSVDVRDYVGNAVDGAVLDLAGVVEASTLTITDTVVPRLDTIDTANGAIRDDTIAIRDTTGQLPDIIDGATSTLGDRIENRLGAVTEPAIDSARDYVVGQGENQRDYVVLQVENARNTVTDRIDESRIVLDAVHAEVEALAAAIPGSVTWDQVGESTFDGVTEWVQSADFYEVQFDVTPPGRPVIPLGDGAYMPHLGWCAIKIGDGFARGPQLEFHKNLVETGKLPASGLLVYCRPGTTGVIRAFDFT